MVQSANQLTLLAQDRERVGAGTDSETAVARANCEESGKHASAAQLARGQALRALELLVGRYPAAEVNARAELLAPPQPIAVGIPLQMLERRPDVIAAERRVAAAFNRVGEAKAARLPQITLSANFGAFESEVLELKEDFENPSGGLGARLLAPDLSGRRSLGPGPDPHAAAEGSSGGLRARCAARARRSRECAGGERIARDACQRCWPTPSTSKRVRSI